MATRRLDNGLHSQTNKKYHSSTVNCLKITNKIVFESVSLCKYARQFVGRSGTISDRLFSCSDSDDLIKQFCWFAVDNEFTTKAILGYFVRPASRRLECLGTHGRERNSSF